MSIRCFRNNRKGNWRASNYHHFTLFLLLLFLLFFLHLLSFFLLFFLYFFFFVEGDVIAMDLYPFIMMMLYESSTTRVPNSI